MQEIPVWQSTELCYHSVKSYATEEKPWKTVQITAEFCSESGTKLVIPGFWDGGNVFKIRFAPTEQGEWKYVVKSSLPELEGEQGTICALPPEEGNPLYTHGGFLKASENGRYITYTDGTPFFYLSDTLWFIPGTVKMPPEVLKPCIEKRKQQGFTAIIIGYIEGSPGKQIQEYYHKTGDIDPAFWKVADDCFRTILESGMTIVAQPMWADTETWPTDAEWEDLLDYMTARYCAWPIHYGMGPEFDSKPKQESGLDERSLKMLGYLRGQDPYHRAYTTQPNPWNLDTTRKDWACPAVDVVALEGGHEDPWGIHTSYYKQAWEHERGGRHTPLIILETVWEGIMRHQFPPHSAYTIRYNMYRAFLSGCMGMSYGANGLWYPRSTEDDDVYDRDWGVSPVWDVALQFPGADSMTVLKNLFANLKWWDICPLFDGGVPSPDIEPPYPVEETPEIMPQVTRTNQVIPFPSDKDNYRVPSVAAFEQGRKLVIYIPQCKSKNSPVFISVQQTGTYQCKWYDVRSGNFISAGTVNVSGKTQLQDRPDEQDWILMMEETEHV